MPGRTARLLLCALLAFTASEAGGSDYGRTLYQWSDADGVVRYTTHPERVPRDRRVTLVPVEADISANQNARRMGEPTHDPATTAARPGPTESGEAPGVPNLGAADPSAQQSLAAAAPEGLAELDRRIAALEVEIERDEETVKILISDPVASSAGSSPELAEIAGRLPAGQAELRALRERREALLADHERF